MTTPRSDLPPIVGTCIDCHRPMRRARLTLKDVPGTVPQASRYKCGTCHRRGLAVKPEKRRHVATLPVEFDAAAFDAKHRIIDAPVKPCCARCRRGTKQYAATDVCGFNGKCKCHG